jgi:hypothetical protein
MYQSTYIATTPMMLDASIVSALYLTIIANPVLARSASRVERIAVESCAIVASINIAGVVHHHH